MTVAKRLLEARLRAELNQRDLARKAGLSNAYVSQVEAGIDAAPGAEGVIRNPSADKLARLAEALGVRPEWLAFGTGEMLASEADKGAA